MEKYYRNKASKSYNVTEHIKSENNVNLRVISFLKAFVEELLICNINRVKWINENMEELPKYAIDMTSSGILHSSNIQARLRHTFLSTEKGFVNFKST